MIATRSAIVTTALFAIVTTANAAEPPDGMSWMPSDPLDITLNGGQSYDLWLNLASGTNMSRTAPFIMGGVNYGDLPYSIPGNAGGGMFPGMTMWAPYKSQFWTSATRANLIKTANGTGGGPYPAGSSIYFGGTSPVSNTNGGSLAVKGYAVPAVKTVTFQISIGEAYGYSLWDADGDGFGPADMPKLKVYDAEGGLLSTLPATHSDIIKKAYNGSMEMPPGSGLDEDIYINTFGLQWNLDGIEGTIGLFQVDWTGVQHAQLWSLRLDQTDTAYSGFVFDLTSNWTGAGDGVWSTAANWQGGVLPSTVGKAVFGTSGTIELGANTAIGQVLLNSADDLTISSANDSKLTPSLNILTAANGGPASHTISADVGLPSIITLDVGQDTGLNLSGDISGVGFYKRGGGTLTLGGAGNYSGSLIFGGGVTHVSGSNLTSDGSLLDLKNARLVLQGNDRFESEFKAKLSGTSILGQSAYIQLGDAASGPVTQTLADLSAAKPQYVKDLNPNPQTEPPVFVVGGSAGISTLTLKGGLYSGNLGGPGVNENNLSVVIEGSPVLQGTSTYAGDTVIKAGATLQANRDAALSINGNLVIEGGNLALGGFTYMTPGGTNDNGTPVTESMSNFARPLGTGAGELRFAGGGGFRAVQGDRTVNLGGAGAQVTWGQGGFIADGSVLSLGTDSTSTITFANPIDLGSGTREIRVESNSSAVLGGVLSGSGGFTKLGFGSLSLSALNTYTGPTRVAGGQLRFPELGNAGGPSFLGDSSNAPGNIILSGGIPEGYGGGQLSYTGDGAASTDRLFTISGTVGSVGNEGSNGSIHYTNTGAVAFDNNGPVVLELRGGNNNVNIFDPHIIDNGEFKTTLRKAGVNGVGGTGGYWKIGREDNSYTGQTIIASGVLEITKIANGGVISSIGASSNAGSSLTMFQAGIKYTGEGDTTDRLFGIAVGSTNPTLKASRIDSSGSGPLVFTNPGELVYSDVDGSSVAMTTGGWTALGGTNTGDNIFSPKITGWAPGNARFFKDGAGRWTLTHTGSTYAGITEIRGGILGVHALKDSGAAAVMITTANSTTASVTSAAGLAVGQLVQGGGVQLGTTITAISGTTVTLSLPATHTITSGNNRNKVTGFPSSIGASSALPASLVIDGGTLQYLGAGDSTNRRFTVGAGGAGLDASGTGALAFSSTEAVTYAPLNAARTLTFSGSNAGNNTFAAAIGNAGTGAVSLVKSGSGSWALTGTNTYTGNTSVNGGILSLSAPGLADGSSVSVATGAVLNLNYPATSVDLVQSLTLAGDPAAPGEWGAEGSGAQRTSPLITGTGRIRVAGPFEAWAGQITNAALRDRNADADGDGFTNLMEYLFGSSPTVPNSSPVQVARSGEGLVLRWQELAAGASYQLQETSTLAENPWPASGIAPMTAADQTGIPAGYVLKEAAVPIDSTSKFLRVNATED
ncbi:beta strand repeat-containing protein [Luteolibacter sp. Populi]|uniref:beta strand repeat-containing protein n=1 Tax=Luteolibacter sp. Populi TaxID=3230487 RepID=UPI0034661038